MPAAKNLPIADYPKIVGFVGFDDAGAYGNANCPHCGAKCRYIKWFSCLDGQVRGAAAGCIKLFPWATDADLS